MPLLNLDALPVSRLLDWRMADDERGVVTISCEDHYNIPVSLQMLATAVEAGLAEVLFDPTAHDDNGVSPG